ncbi:acetyl-CoA carboxylase carboxyl transferase subunit alpha [Metabacillus litoralis]|uniref:acetyl-CoA carboxylase carboxyl transferase subunit alpha n=1 Tax=Metabacillus litoralis TaxID=152268 RepID=UPI00203AD149|nr:acetyl-CoA carboxylase carboxyl transferase subunit alpha [Metabacillus litoralis]MCM3651768.1 acetyl-CoA carboxylase carboxyl transferase subunit alpha [Metabacillus litoralis]
MKNFLDFEGPIIELKDKISDLKEFMSSKEIDLSDEVNKLEHKLQQLEKKIYKQLTPWDRVQVSRHPNRPTSLDYIQELFTDFLEMHGDRTYGDDPAIVGGICRFEDQPVTIIGHQRGKDTKENIYRNFGMPHPEGYRKALRLMKQAEKFQRPIITFIDTKGAYPGKAAEERGQSQAIANNLFEMASLTVPVISIVIGEGGSGGALGLGVCNHLHMLENSTYSVISPEGAAALLWKDASKAQLAAETMKITAYDLKELGIVDELIPEVKGGAHSNLTAQAKEIREVLRKSLAELKWLERDDLVKNRYEKYKQIGHFSIKEDFKRKVKELVVN